MPEISRFFGIVIRMYWTDHGPPHFHARYADHRCSIDIATLSILSGHCLGAIALTLEWAVLHREALMEDWQLCAANQSPKRIPPLD